ncbi:uncharacterized protein LAESUDRAFT_711634 [Laetiporus sulphureus 93-53]|uniref:Uncharacterized protein n=1 Tax=Laetiporus sulphureus 93-53 TaxID=1314785 RepID=A0A165GK77_9APHY|nr:uncharacterized protein LAESUDRAFT_711634 [Laetiporus sulphureus 93-53]KZT10467.1 hypothetical protein LAESUDRAFT_711634 [Laetiporus sulphureus 93-53]
MAQAFLKEIAPDGGGVSSFARLANSSAPRASPRNGLQTPAMVYAEHFVTDFLVLDGMIDQFVASLSPIEAAPTWQDDARMLLLTHTFALAATIQVHGTLKQAEGGTAQGRDVAAAHAAAAARGSTNLAQLAFVDPILAERPPSCRLN